MTTLKKLKELKFRKELGWTIVVIAIIIIGAIVFFVQPQATKKISAPATPVAATCVASDANLSAAASIYAKGTVTSVDSAGNVRSFEDDCLDAVTMEKFICYESPVGSGHYASGRTVVKCANGCVDGACQK
jgi:hypothetical protein